jgi:hypothetical protein
VAISRSGRSVATYLLGSTARISSVSPAFGNLNSQILAPADWLSSGVEDLLTRILPNQRLCSRFGTLAFRSDQRSCDSLLDQRSRSAPGLRTFSPPLSSRVLDLTSRVLLHIDDSRRFRDFGLRRFQISTNTNLRSESFRVHDLVTPVQPRSTTIVRFGYSGFDDVKPRTSPSLFSRSSRSFATYPF